METGLMKGAYEYHKTIAEAIKLGVGDIKPFQNLGGRIQDNGTMYYYRNVVFVLGAHTEGLTFNIYITDSNSVLKVYGMTKGTYGRNEGYGWLHRGNWDNFLIQYLDELKRQIRAAKKARLKDRIVASTPQVSEEEMNKFEKAFNASAKEAEEK